MGIRTFTFNGESSDTYGILITQNASFNAPERAGEMLSIPGRNGAFWQDYGRFENIEVTYHCAVGEGSKADFVDAMSDVRSWLCSPIGYCRLEDDYNPNEYRMAVYKSGLETDEPFLTGAEFDIVFECKPQRFLKSGETAVSITSGDTITNPTRFDAQPLLQVRGYGDIDINGNPITIDNVVLGNIVLNTGTNYTNSLQSYPLNGTNRMNVGDDFIIDSIKANVGISVKSGSLKRFKSATVTSVTCSPNTLTGSAKVLQVAPTNIDVSIELNKLQLVWETSETATVTASVTFVDNDNVSYSKQFQLYFIYTMSNPDKISVTGTTYDVESWYTRYANGTISDITAYSTVSALGNPSFLDMETGEAYKVDSDEIISLNACVHMPAELPTLQSGANTITYDNTFTSFKVVPRWWQV